LLEKARAEGPYDYTSHVLLYEQLGIAHAYLDRKQEALRAFDMLLALDPGHALSYTLSPKVTFLFEQARKGAAAHPAPTVDMSWPRGLKANEPVPIDVEVVADPKGFLHRGSLYHRRRGTALWAHEEFPLPGQGGYRRVELPPANPDATGPEVVQIYLAVTDAGGNQVLLVGDDERPREIALAYEQPQPWYRKWWVWALVGGAVAVGTGATVYFTLYEPPGTVDDVFQIR